MVIIRNGPGIDTKVYVKPTDAVADPGEGSAPYFLDQGRKKFFGKKHEKTSQESDFLEFYRKGQVKITT